MIIISTSKNINYLQDWFLKSAKEFPNNYALYLENKYYTYRQLDIESKKISSILIEGLIHRPKKVGLLAGVSKINYISILGILRTGSTYVPLNPKYGIERIITIIEESELDSLIVDEESIDVFNDLYPKLKNKPFIVLPEIINKKCVDKRNESYYEKITLNNDENYKKFAYLLFTSGSTGKPKGVPITHENVNHFLDINLKRYKITPNDRISQFFDRTFDLSIFDIFLAWGSGACLYPLKDTDILLPWKFIEKNKITVWFSVPSIITLMKRINLNNKIKLTSLRWSLFCGEALPSKSAEFWSELAPNSIIENLYGPTELTIACSVYRWNNNGSNQKNSNGIVPIGKIYDGLDYILIDRNNNVSKFEGELCVTGPQMFHGYLDPQFNKDSFFCHKSSSTNIKYYRTGDLVQISDSGDLMFKGRIDNQVKVKGYRVELSEVEAVIRGLDCVVDVVVLHNKGIIDCLDDYLVAFVISDKSHLELINNYIKERLPRYMLPKRIFMLDKFPLNVNGKVDRKQLLKFLNLERVN